MDKIARVRQEIEQLRKLLEDHNYYLDNSEQALGYGLALDDIGQFLDTLPEEPDKSLEEAAKNYIAPIENDEGLDYINFNGRDIKNAFIAGAEWQKEQMLKGAVEGEVIVPIYEGDDTWSAEIKIPGTYNIGDKVRIIVLKAEEE